MAEVRIIDDPIKELSQEYIMVTGSNGTLGRAFEELLRQTKRPYLSHSKDFGDLAQERLWLGPFKVRAVVHLAAAVPRHPDRPDDQALAEQTRAIDASVLETAIDNNVPVIYPSGCSLYAPGAGQALSEDAALQDSFASPYLAAKRDGEQAVLAYEQGCVLRVAGFVGPGVPSTAVAGRFMEAASNDETIDLWGDGSREQSFVDLRDIARALLACVDKQARGVYNIAADAPTSMRDLAEMAVAVAGKGRWQLSGQPDPQDGCFARFDTQKARQELGWSPRWSLAQSLHAMTEPNTAHTHPSPMTKQ